MKYFFIFILISAIVVFATYYIIQQVVVRKLDSLIKDLDDKIKKLNKEIRDLNNKICELEKRNGGQQYSGTEISDLSKVINSLLKRFDDLDEKFTKLLETQNSKQLASNIVLPPTEIERPQNVKYAKNFKDGFMVECQENEAYFKLTLQGNDAKFEFCGDKSKAIAQKNATFDDVCDTLSYSINAKDLCTQELGYAQLQSGGNWKVTKKAKIKFE